MDTLKSTFHIFILLIITTICQAQSHQIIVQLNEDITIDQLIASNSMSPIASYKQLSKNLNIWLIEILLTQTTLKKEMALTNLQNHPQVKVAQLNEVVTLRNTPNDFWFNDQWQYNNKGENQGITDADIDGPEAWQKTTGGLTAMGDEIVVAVIDGGVDLTHPDLINNLWTNQHEIPNNQIDDDQNGYIDDYYGWNFNDSIADIGNAGYGHWHGTPVTGIIGAEGNNTEGVCGVNWQVKVMNLVANQTVAGVIAAYDYVLEMRKRYNETNGQAGAFIVATNASLGINEGKPADHPLWCAMYNALGNAGILNVAATANNLINIDERGDMPTTCSSPFLISVTNTNNRDELEFAAFGRKHIDLGAPGTGVFTVSNNGNYGVFGGTSAAAPHVAGAIVLLYSTPNIGLMRIVKNDPSKTTLLLKDFILQGTDPIADLYHKSVSNGRLNLFNSLCEMENYFDKNACREKEMVDFKIDQVLVNQVNDEVFINFEFLGKSKVKVRLFNITGQLMQQQHLININTGNHQIRLSLDQLDTGVYYINIHSENAALNQTIVVN